MLAINGCNVTCIDLAKDARSDAKAKAAERHLNVNFIVADALRMDRIFMEAEFDVVIDSGLFHTMADEEKPIFARQVHWVLKSSGNISCSVFSIWNLKSWGPEGPQKLKCRVYSPCQFRPG
jgi:ubiquinone/menaquinone biosynthesis C-methylase UbiE